MITSMTKGRTATMKNSPKPGLIERLSKIPYTGAISDILDEMGFTAGVAEGNPIAYPATRSQAAP
jgi:hypothetical protein